MGLILGDCLEVLQTLSENSIDSLVTDPPARISFMGKDWDSDKGGREGWITWMTSVMKEVHRVLKPGAHGLVWAIPRTSHWTATALENAGFEIRDCIYHLHGTGFPKSLNIKKAAQKSGIACDGSEGRLHHGTSSRDGQTSQSSSQSNRSSTSQGSQYSGKILKAHGISLHSYYSSKRENLRSFYGQWKYRRCGKKTGI